MLFSQKKLTRRFSSNFFLSKVSKFQLRDLLIFQRKHCSRTSSQFRNKSLKFENPKILNFFMYFLQKCSLKSCRTFYENIVSALGFEKFSCQFRKFGICHENCEKQNIVIWACILTLRARSPKNTKLHKICFKTKHSFTF